ncbi:hypothetical protein C8Q75DRAFT_69849 [Abortiporus biennis]|nr:hypothetical protein C8Q75DRAFT_69849 [Abortiporus biennis]
MASSSDYFSLLLTLFITASAVYTFIATKYAYHTIVQHTRQRLHARGYDVSIDGIKVIPNIPPTSTAKIDEHSYDIRSFGILIFRSSLVQYRRPRSNSGNHLTVEKRSHYLRTNLRERVRRRRCASSS